MTSAPRSSKAYNINCITDLFLCTDVSVLLRTDAAKALAGGGVSMAPLSFFTTEVSFFGVLQPSKC